MDKNDAGFFGYDKAEKRRNTWCIPSFDNEVRAEKDKLTYLYKRRVNRPAQKSPYTREET